MSAAAALACRLYSLGLEAVIVPLQFLEVARESGGILPLSLLAVPGVGECLLHFRESVVGLLLPDFCETQPGGREGRDVGTLGSSMIVAFGNNRAHGQIRTAASRASSRRWE